MRDVMEASRSPWETHPIPVPILQMGTQRFQEGQASFPGSTASPQEAGLQTSEPFLALLHWVPLSLHFLLCKTEIVTPSLQGHWEDSALPLIPCESS